VLKKINTQTYILRTVNVVKDTTLKQCSDVLLCAMIQVRMFDAATNQWTVKHPLRTAYYSFISAVLFFLPIVTMTVAYVLIIWKLWSSKRPGEALGPELKTYDSIKKRVLNAVLLVIFYKTRIILLLAKQGGFFTFFLKIVFRGPGTQLQLHSSFFLIWH